MTSSNAAWPAGLADAADKHELAEPIVEALDLIVFAR